MKKLLSLVLLGVIRSLQASEPKFLTRITNESDHTMNMLIIPAIGSQEECIFGSTLEAEIVTTFIGIPPREAHHLHKKIHLNPHTFNALSILVNGTPIRLEDKSIVELFQSTELIINKDTSWRFNNSENITLTNNAFTQEEVIITE